MAKFPSIDESLLNDIPEGVTVLKQPIWEPYGFYKKLLGKKSSEKINTGFLTEHKKPKRIESFSVWVRGNFFIPDARKFWIKPSIKYLNEYLSKNPVDLIISTGPPHSMHLIAMGLKSRFPNLPWIADFRDPWTNIDFYKDLKLSTWADKKHKKLEHQVLQTADTVITIGKTLGEELVALGAKKLVVIHNGFDTDDISIKDAKVALDTKFTIAHIGSMNKARNPKVLWKALNELVSENKDFASELAIKLVGKVDYVVQEELKENGLTKYVKKIDYIPHNEVIIEQQKSHILLLVVNDAPNAKGILTGKIFEYLAAERPILAIAPKDGDLAAIINETESGAVFEDHLDQVVALKTQLLTLFNFRNQTFESSKKYQQFSRKNLTKQLSEVIKELV